LNGQPNSQRLAPKAFDGALPIDAVLPDVVAALTVRPNAVVVAPPGAGKTTRLPLALLDQPWMRATDGSPRKVLMLEPRRLAARGAAARMASTLGEQIGETIGLRVRLGSKVGPRTRIEVVTEGVFTRMILDDPELTGIAGVIFDEFHERSLDADFGLALALDAQSALREDLRILVMSATLDGARVARLLSDAPIIESEGRAFPVETRHMARAPGQRIEEAIVNVTLRALRAEPGSLLVFLPGQGEIRRLAEQLTERIDDPTLDIAPLYGALDQKEQDRAVSPSPPGRRKIVLATSIAETSLTIEGVRVVIDSGLARVPRYEPDIGLTRLETVRVSRAAADQRRGRAGRTEPGVCYRLWEEAATGALEPFAKPEIMAADLAPLLLDCAAWGVTDPAQLAFLDPPPVPALNEARTLLSELGALDPDGRLTALGGRLQKLPLPPRLARMVVAASETGAARDAAEIAAILVERGLGGDGTDLGERLERFRRDRSPRAQDMRRLATNWAGQMGGNADRSPGALSPAALLALAYPDRIAKARGKPGEFLMANGRGAALDPADRLARAPYLAIAEIAGGAASARILLAAEMELAEVEAAGSGRIVEATETVFDRAPRALRTRAVRRLGAIALNEKPLPVPADGTSAAILARGIAALGLDVLPWTKALGQWRGRVMFLRAAEGDLWPDLSDATLLATIEDWLAPHLTGVSSLGAITPDLLDGAFKALVPWDMQRRLDADAPTHFEAPTGSRLPIDYAAEGGPAVEVRVQELFGLTAHPSVAEGRVPLTLHLLSPAHRPIQITRDLPGFWRGSWASVRADMRGRYPKHPWPDDPAQAEATRRAKPRGT
jgi:ATP-dependent helicase HrpB